MMTDALYYDTNLLTHQAVWSAIVVCMIRRAKCSRWAWLQWINAHTWLVNRAIAITASGLVTLGLHWKYGYSAHVDGGTLTFVVTGVSLWGIVEHGRDWLFSYIVQQGFYRVTERASDASTVDIARAW